MRFILLALLVGLFGLAFWKQKPGPPVSLPPLTPMPAWHKTAVSLSLMVFLAGSAFVTLLSEQAWPIVRYRIYDIARVRPRVTYLRLVGTLRDGSEFRILDNKYLAPLDFSLLAGTVQNMLKSENAQATLDAMVADIYARYEKHRQEHRHDGPPLVRLQLVREIYSHVDPRASNIGHPDRQQILSEYTIADHMSLKGSSQ